jgi:hypothetical protein
LGNRFQPGLCAVEYYDAIGIVGGVTCRKHELIPGLSFDGAVMTGMNELLEQAGSAQYSVKLLKKLGEITLKSCTGASCVLSCCSRHLTEMLIASINSSVNSYHQYRNYPAY